MPSAPSIKTPSVVLVLAVSILCVAWWAMYSSDGAAKARERDGRLEHAQGGASANLGPTPRVDFIEVRRAANAEVVALSSALEPVQSTWVSAEMAGRIVAIPAAEHAPISAGAALVELDAALPQAELIRARAAHTLARAELERQKTLGNRSVASQAELDRATSFERQSYATLVEARTRLAHTKISAPFDGIVNSLDLDLGSYVQPGTRIAEVIDASTLELSVAVSDRQVAAIRVGDSVRVRVDALGNRITNGRVVRVARAPQDGGRRFPVVVALDNRAGEMLPGMLAEVLIEIGNAASIRIPAQAVISEFELDYVFVIGDDGLAKRVRIATRPVPFRSDQVVVESGLREGERVVTSGIMQLRDGQAVEARPATGAGAQGGAPS